ncbi:AI-2E family transporter [Sphingobacterium rhinopitheci]|uniref:AI-2E family transporter n=1 Tax=Sphingobacterium rhinopitheci TaxID=2781960 RepID=UPI001F51A275|nr:AI-2E family transporter [Sphingobacterium rhinopitheci]MCI0921220.1 AI-2E family transporter [Sphingobacterium rhinopitheci]
MQRFLTLPFYTKLACTLVSIIGLGYIMHVGQLIIVPLILGLLFALLLVPVCNWLENKLRFPRLLAAIVGLIAFFGLIVGLLVLIGSQLTMLKEDWPSFEQQILHETRTFQDWVTSTFNIGYRKQAQYLNETLSSSVSKGTAIVGIALISLSSLLILLVFTLLYTFFLLIYRRHILRFLILLNKKEHESVVIDIVKEIQFVVKKYLIGLIVQMCIVATMTFIVLSVIGVKYTVMLAMITGVINVLPYVGIFSAIIIISIITFATSSAANVLFVIIGLWIVHLIDSNFVVPKIVGSKVKVNSLFAMLAIISGELIWGVSGMFLAIPVLAIAKIICDRIYDLKPWGFLLGEDDSSDHSFHILRGQLHGAIEIQECKDDAVENEDNAVAP